MELTSAHLRYLLAIYEVSRTHLDISSRSIAEKLGVTKPSTGASGWPNRCMRRWKAFWSIFRR